MTNFRKPVKNIFLNMCINCFGYYSIIIKTQIRHLCPPNPCNFFGAGKLNRAEYVLKINNEKV